MLTLEHVEHAYGDRPILDQISLHLRPGQIGSLLGPSGCGKTTALRLIAGFEPLQAGRIRLNGQWVTPQDNLAPQSRNVGLVFQDHALFPHLSVRANVAFGLHRLAPAAARERVDAMLELVGLSAEAERMPQQLSGGQQQRVALARALAPRPALLLMDEPFSSLDVELREQLGSEVHDILKREGITALLVTHDQHEAFAVADMVGVMRDGCIEQWDTPYNLYHRPASQFVADFVGQGVFLRGKVSVDGGVSLQASGLDIPLPQSGTYPRSLVPGTWVDILLRPDDVVHDDASPLKAVVERRAFRGAEFLYSLRLADGSRLLSLVPSHHNHAIGEHIGIRLEVDHLVAFSVTGTDTNTTC